MSDEYLAGFCAAHNVSLCDCPHTGAKWSCSGEAGIYHCRKQVWERLSNEQLWAELDETRAALKAELADWPPEELREQGT